MSVIYMLMMVAFTSNDPSRFPKCEYEDSTNCYWDATTMGNGKGTSFVNVNGNLYLVD